MRPGRAEIVGAGFGGLCAAIGLADRGWQVRVHERRATIRGEGYGIAVHRNMACIFAAFDVLDEVLAGGHRIDRRDTLDRTGQIVLSQATARSAYRVDRQHVVTVLADRARRAGAEISLGSRVERATPDGEILFADGGTADADLIVGADGVNSPLRDALGLLERRVWGRDGGVRLAIPRLATEQARDARHGTPLVEAWSDRRRVLFCPMTADMIYLLLTCLHDDAAARRTPLDVAAWTRSFPSLEALFQRARDDADWEAARWARFQTISLKRWSAGRVAILGDAAHAMGPYLAQGAGHAMMNGLALAVALAEAPDLPGALAAWERRERPLTEHTQRWTRIYGWTMLMPDLLKRAMIRAETRLPWITRQYVRAANHLPTGTQPLTRAPFALPAT